MARSSAPGQTAIDYVTIVLSPVLIMGLVGSLVFFLLEVLYQQNGPWKERLQWILFFYVLGAVLASRISMKGEIASRFWIYGSILAGLTFFGMQSFIEYPDGVKEISFIINLGLVVLVWWCAHRLTWDCTNVDEEADISGEGVLQAAGLESVQDDANDEAEEKKTLWKRWQDYQQRRAKKRTLGVWVVYFSLAALPIFGLGQSLIPLTAPDRRQFVFWLMMIYVGCGLGLLLTTCFLGLRRYLRQKRLQMPASMTGAWLTSGAVLIVVLLLVGALLPRPYAEYSILDVIDPAGSAKRKANQMAFKGDSPAEGEGQPGQGKPDGKEAGNQNGKEKGKGQDKSGKDGQGKRDKDGKDGAKSQQDKGKSGGQDKDSKGGEKGGQDKSKQQPKEGQKGKAQKGGRAGKQNENKDGKQGGQQSQRSSSNPLTAIQQFLQRVAPWLKWIVFAVLAVLVLVALFRGGLGFLANFNSWAKGLLEAWRRFWANLFGAAKTQTADGDEADEDGTPAEPATPFSAYSNPFDSGRADRMSPRQLVRYTFAALEAWAREQDMGRRPDETAIEFIERLSEEIPALEAEGKRLAQLHARAEYAAGSLPAATLDVLRAFWQRLERVAAAPLSA